MSHELTEKNQKPIRRPESGEPTLTKQTSSRLKSEAKAVLNLQQKAGNQAVQRLLAQRKGGEGFDLDQDTADRINNARGWGQPLDGSVQEQMSASMGHDFSGVRVHTSAESDTLNKELSAKAFTTGRDVFFRQGEYNPGSSAGKELIAHELTHVVQQSTGQVPGGGSSMTVRPAGDSFEQAADAAAKQATSPGNQPVATSAGNVQRQPEEGELQAKFEDVAQRTGEEDELAAPVSSARRGARR